MLPIQAAFFMKIIFDKLFQIKKSHTQKCEKGRIMAS